MPRNDFAEAYFFKYSVDNKLTRLSEAIRKSSPDAEANAKKFFDAKAQKKDAKPAAKKETLTKTQPKKASANDLTSDSDAENPNKPAPKQALTPKLQPKKSDAKAPSSDSSSDSDAPSTAKPAVAPKVDTKKSKIEAPTSDSSSDSGAPIPVKSVVSKKTHGVKELSKLVLADSEDSAKPAKIMKKSPKHQDANDRPQSMPRPKKQRPVTTGRPRRFSPQQNSPRRIQSRPKEDRWARIIARLRDILASPLKYSCK